MSINPQECPTALCTETKPISLQTILKDVLSDEAPAPYTANAFFDFVSNKHCTELLDFIVKVQDYHDLYTNWESFFGDTKETRESARIGKEWRCLMSNFISPGSPNELNLPWNIRNQLLSHFDPMLCPPRPDQLDPAVHHTCETLTDVFMLFLRGSPSTNGDRGHQRSGLSDSFIAQQWPFLKRSSSKVKEISDMFARSWKPRAPPEKPKRFQRLREYLGIKSREKEDDD